MAENHIELHVGKFYDVIGGGRRGDKGQCREVRAGHFGRYWGLIDLGKSQESTWIRSSHLAPQPEVPTRYQSVRSS